MRRSLACLSLFLGLVLGAGQAGAVAQGRGTAERIARAQFIRKVRAGLTTSAVTKADKASLVEMSHLLSPNEKTVEVYGPYARVIFLSDGDPRYWESLAEPIAEVFPHKTIVKGDFDIKGEHHHGNLTAMHIDNTHRLPLVSGSADLVVMRRGLCQCHGKAMCGGLHATVPEMRRFFDEVYRVLDPKNRKATAYLHGGHGNTARLKVFLQAADELMALHPEVKIEFVTTADSFQAVRITHAAPQN